MADGAFSRDAFDVDAFDELAFDFGCASFDEEAFDTEAFDSDAFCFEGVSSVTAVAAVDDDVVGPARDPWYTELMLAEDEAIIQAVIRILLK